MDLNLHQKRWLELLKDSDNSVLYHLGKVNMVEVVLNRLLMGSLALVEEYKKELFCDIHRLG